MALQGEGYSGRSMHQRTSSGARISPKWILIPLCRVRPVIRGRVCTHPRHSLSALYCHWYQARSHRHPANGTAIHSHGQSTDAALNIRSHSAARLRRASVNGHTDVGPCLAASTAPLASIRACALAEREREKERRGSRDACPCPRVRVRV